MSCESPPVMAFEREFPSLRFALAAAEQTAIATVLSDMDTEIAAPEVRLAKTQALKQGMTEGALLTGKTRLI